MFISRKKYEANLEKAREQARREVWMECENRHLHGEIAQLKQKVDALSGGRKQENDRAGDCRPTMG